MNPRFGYALVFAFALVASAAFAAEETLPASLASSYRLQHETHALSSDDSLAVLSTALRFYSPPRTQVRWLESLRLPEGPVTPAASLGPRTLEALVSRLGTRYRYWKGERDEREGVRLRFSSPYASSEDSARVVVESQYLASYSSGPVTTQVFLVTRNKNTWRIASRGMAKAEAAQN